MGFWESITTFAQEVTDFMHSLNIVTVFIRIALATAFGSFIGIQRGKQGRAAGMRTHVLVAIGAALASMIGIFLYSNLGMSNDPTRIAAQVVSGIGFLGVGTILIKGRFQITGLTTAAGLWAVAAIGLALGVGFYLGAIITFVCAMLTVTIMAKAEYLLTKRYNRFGIYVELKSDEYVRTAMDMLKTTYNVSDIQVTIPRSGKVGNVGIEANVHFSQKKGRISPDVIAREIEKNDYVSFALESI